MAHGFKSGGRTKGTPNKATNDVKVLAQQYGPEALEKIWYLAQHAEAEQVRLSACSVILDRAYGKATQPIEGDVSGFIVQVVRIEGQDYVPVSQAESNEVAQVRH